ncbi:hypothetical protein F5Y14DRAFT_428331 [Nemania sp. NC0429]|nr:hypothetical protein F5Y14DRAFT_428331 [Nemania sp. NC0429]
MQFTTFVVAALSMGSAIAGPIAGFKHFDNAVTAVAQAKTVVQEQLATIEILVGGVHTAETVTKLQKSLVTVSANVNGLVGPALALVNVKSTLSQVQLSAVPKFAEDFQGLLISIEAIGKKVTGSNLSQNVIAQIKPELQLVLSTASPVARPIISFINVAAPSYVPEFQKVTAILVNIQALSTLVIGPLSGLGLVTIG